MLPGNPHLGQGFHADEGGHRWTNGNDCLPRRILGLFAGSHDIEMELAPTTLGYAATDKDLRFADPQKTGDRMTGDPRAPATVSQSFDVSADRC